MSVLKAFLWRHPEIMPDRVWRVIREVWNHARLRAQEWDFLNARTLNLLTYTLRGDLSEWVVQGRLYAAWVIAGPASVTIDVVPINSVEMFTLKLTFS